MFSRYCQINKGTLLKMKKEFRCKGFLPSGKKCNSLLAMSNKKEELSAEIKCKKCKTLNDI